MNRALRRRAWAALLVGLLACDEPPAFPTADRRQNTVNGRIEGEVIVTTRARGNVIVLLYDDARPPPPTGSGRPLSFAVLPAERLFGDWLFDTSAQGPFVTPYTFSLVPPGRYQLRAFLDRDDCLQKALGCRPADFIPWYGVTAEPNAQDVGGGAIDALTRAPLTVEIAATPEARVTAATGVPVVIHDSAALPADRPVFFPNPAQAQVAPQGVTALELSVMAIDLGVVHQRAPAFLVRYVDDNGDGVPDDANKDGVGDLWPKVLVRKLAVGAHPLADENDLDRNGVLDAVGPSYEHLNPATGATIPADEAPDAVVLAAGVDPTDFLPALTDPQGRPRLGFVVPATRLRVIIRPQALDVASRSGPVPLKGLPAGNYALTLVQFTGQTWRVPNELSRPLADALGLPAFDNQGVAVRVP